MFFNLNYHVGLWDGESCFRNYKFIEDFISTWTGIHQRVIEETHSVFIVQMCLAIDLVDVGLHCLAPSAAYDVLFLSGKNICKNLNFSLYICSFNSSIGIKILYHDHWGMNISCYWFRSTVTEMCIYRYARYNLGIIFKKKFRVYI